MKSNFLHPILLALLPAVPLQHGFAADQEPLQLHLPIDCVIGESCWVLNYFDTDPSAGAVDFTCAARTYDGHKGTDIAVRDQATMDKGVAVLAAMDGRVGRVHDGEPDRVVGAEDFATLRKAGKQCGNTVVIDHGNRVLTQYCHLKKGSVNVQPNQQVKAGEKIGEVGASGATTFPHVHFQLARDGANVDPFTGFGSDDGCGRSEHALWHRSANMRYQGTTIWAGGFHNAPLGKDDVDRGGLQAPAVISTTDPAIVFWMSVLGPRKDDIVRTTITDSAGRMVARTEYRVPMNLARRFQLVAHKLVDIDLEPGNYTGRGEVMRAGQPVQILEKAVTVAAPSGR